MDDFTKEFLRVGGVIFATTAISIGLLVGSVFLYKSTIERTSCEAFQKKYPQAEVFFSLDSGCMYKPSDSQYWWRV